MRLEKGKVKSPVLAFDPGVTTGVAFVTAEGKLTDVKMVRGDRAEIELAQMILKVREKHPTVRIVIEDFVGQGKRNSYGNYTLGLVYWLKNWCRYHEIPGVLHSPQTRKPYIELAQALIRRGGLQYATHTYDASAHALCYWSAL